MLTKKDLQLIAEVVDQKIELRLKPIDKRLKTMNKKLNRVVNDVSWIAKEFDTEIVTTRRRVDRIEKNLNIS